VGSRVRDLIRLKDFRWVFWDFDGVIKESVDAKGDAFARLFVHFGEKIAKRVRVHHESNGGMSRYQKIPLYLDWAGEKPTVERVNDYCQRFGDLTRQAVIQSQWVPGVEAILRDNPYEQTFVLVSATPQHDIEHILDELNLRRTFLEVCGAPTSKAIGVRCVLERYSLLPTYCVFIGDSQADWDAATENRMPFILRKHASNSGTFQRFTGHFLRDFTNL